MLTRTAQLTGVALATAAFLSAQNSGLKAWQSDYGAFADAVAQVLKQDAVTVSVPASLTANVQPRWGIASSDQQKAYDSLDRLLAGKTVTWQAVVQKVVDNKGEISLILGLPLKDNPGPWSFPKVAVARIEARSFPVYSWEDPPAVWIVISKSWAGKLTSFTAAQKVTFRGLIRKSKLPDEGIVLVMGVGGSLAGRNCVAVFLDDATVEATR
jgi:hypothetical protein